MESPEENREPAKMKKNLENDAQTTENNGSDPAEVPSAEPIDEEVEKWKEEADKNYQKVLRLSADMENLRKRVEKEKADLAKYGQEKLLKDLLPVLDSFEKALPEADHSADSAVAAFAEGAHLVKKQLLEVLEKHGFEEVAGEKGDTFDPNLHQAIQRIESADVSDEVLHEVYAKGYSLHGRLVRAAMVSVLVPGDSKE